MKLKFFIYFAFAFYLICSSYSLSQVKINEPGRDNPAQLVKYVTDETGTLNSNQLTQLNNKLVSFNRTTSNQVLVYLIPSLNGESLEDYSIRLAEKNKIGKKDKNNGVLVLIVKDDRKIRIEVGYGLEGVLTDAMSSKIIRNDFTPQFKSGKYYEGIDKGIDAIISVTKGEYTSDKNQNDMNAECCFGMPVFVILIFGIIFIFIFTSFVRNMFGVGRTIYSGKSGWGSGRGGGGFGGGGSSGGSSGGFSGGGGSFGGGGASGSW